MLYSQFYKGGNLNSTQVNEVVGHHQYLAQIPKLMLHYFFKFKISEREF